MEERPRPNVMPKEKVWIHCERLAEKYGLTPLQVLKELVRIGEDVVDAEENGGKVFNIVNEEKFKIRGLPLNGSGVCDLANLDKVK
jgi:hypothetical protein